MDNLLNMLTNIKVIDGTNGQNEFKKMMTNPIIAGLINNPNVQTKVKEVTDNPMTQTLIKMFANTMNNFNDGNNGNDNNGDDNEDDDTYEEETEESTTDGYEWDNCGCGNEGCGKNAAPQQIPFSFVSDFYNTLWSTKSASILSNYFTSNSQYVKTNYDGEILWKIGGRKKIADYFYEFWLPSHDSGNTQVNSFAINLVNDNDVKVYEIKYNINQPVMDTGCMKWRMANIVARDTISLAQQDGNWYIDTFNTRVISMRMEAAFKNY